MGKQKDKKDSSKPKPKAKAGNEGSIIVLNAPKGAEGYGHLALMVRNSKGGWTFVSKEGRQKNHLYSPKGWIGELIGGPALPPLIKNFKSWQDFRNAQQDNSPFAKNIVEYSEAIRLFADERQDSLALFASEKAAHSYYHFLLANCADATSGGLMVAGLNPGYDYAMDPRPNIRFRNIVQDNADEIDTSFHPFDTPLTLKSAAIQRKIDSDESQLGGDIPFLAKPAPFLLSNQAKLGLQAINEEKAEMALLRHIQQELETGKAKKANSYQLIANSQLPPPFVSDIPGVPDIEPSSTEDLFEQPVPVRMARPGGRMTGSDGLNQGENIYPLKDTAKMCNGLEQHSPHKLLKIPKAGNISPSGGSKNGGKGGNTSVGFQIAVSHSNTGQSRSRISADDIYDAVIEILTSAVADSRIGTDIH